MDTRNWFKKKLETFKEDLEFRLEALILDLTEKICIRMKQRNISRVKLAELLKVSPPAVTKILNGNSNFTLKTLLSLADALGLELKINFEEKEIVTPKPIDTSLKPIYISSDDVFIPVIPTEDLWAKSASDTLNYSIQGTKEIGLAEAA